MNRPAGPAAKRRRSADRPRRSMPRPTATGPDPRAGRAGRASTRDAARAWCTSSSASSPPTSRSVGQQHAQHPRQIQGPIRQVDPHQRVSRRRRVARRREQVHDGQHRVQPRRQVLGRRDDVRDARGGDLLLRARDAGPPSSARSPGTRARCPPCVTPQTSRSVSATCASRASAGWQQVNTSRRRSSGITSSSMDISVASGSSSSGSLPSSDRPRAMALSALRRAATVSHAPGRSGHAVARPGRQGGHVGVLHAVLGGVEVARHAHRRGEHVGPLATVRLGHRLLDRVQSTTSKPSSGRTSTPPSTIGVSFASASAWSRSRASST